jgi:hypothetical protein
VHLHAKSTLLWERFQITSNYCKFQAKSSKSFFTFKEIWIISVTKEQHYIMCMRSGLKAACGPPPFVSAPPVKLKLPLQTLESHKCFKTERKNLTCHSGPSH